MNHHQLRRSLGLLLTAVLTIGLTGCWDRTEINDLAYVLTSAIDLEKDGKVRFSVLVPLPGQMGGASGGGGGTGGDKSYYIDSETGSTFREAQSKLQQRMSRRMFLAHRRTLLIGEAMAREGIQEIFDATPRAPESRMTTFMIVTKGKATDLMQSTPKFERFPSEAIRELVKSRSSIQLNMKDIALQLASPGSDTIIPYMDVQDSQKSEKPSKEVQLNGYAQFKGFKMVDILQGEAVDGIAWLKDESINKTVTLKVEDSTYITIRVSDSKTKVKVQIIDGKLNFDVQVEAKFKVAESAKFYDLSKPEKIRTVETALANYVKECIGKALAAMRKNKADSAQFGTLVWQNYPRLWKEQYEAQWPQGLEEAGFQINAKTALTETGLIYENVTKSEKNHE